MRKLLAVLAVAGALAGCGLPMSVPSRHSSTDSAPAAIASPARDGQFTFVVSEAAPAGEHWYGPKPRGQWFIVTMQVTNTGDHPQSFFVGNQKLLDAQGRQYAPDSSQSVLIPVGGSMVDLNPGFDARARLMFDVPPGTQISAVELHDSAFSGGVKVAVK